MSGPAVIFEKVEEVLKGVDGVTLPSMEMKLFPLRSARAEHVREVRFVLFSDEAMAAFAAALD